VASVVPRPDPSLVNRHVFAYVGIADPEKFYRTVVSLGAAIVERRAFPDHHYFTEDEIADLLKDAAKQDLLPVTTSKDAVRLTGHSGKAKELADKTTVVEIDMVFDDPRAAHHIIDAAIANCRQRLLKAR
jgi:tetraacyldisaccharide 4'-kinase